MKSTDERINFSDLCKICEKISNKPKREEKIKVLQAFVDRWRQFHETIYNENKLEGNNDTFYPFMRLLLPQFERERGAYGIKETTLAKLYIDILCLSKEGSDAQKLLNFRAPKAAKGEAGDFASVAALVLKNRCPAAGHFTIADVNKHLDNIASSNAENNKVEVKKNLKSLLCNTSAEEQKWLIRMILKEMKLGISEQLTLKTFHLDAKDLYDVTSSLVKVCTQLKDPAIRLHEIEVSLFSPFRPMLAGRAKMDEVEKTMNNQMFYVETKLDGERVQLHKDGNSFKYFSRNGIEYTQVYGSAPLSGTLTPDIAKLFRSDVESCILDGEMVGWNKNLKCIGTKGQNFDVKTLTEDDPDFQPCFCVFDILYYNGRVLSNVPLKNRLVKLDGLFTQIEGKLLYTPRRESNTKQDVIDALNEAIDQREEGIIIKNPDSIYKPNDRGCSWWKLKPEYVDNLMNELDLIILGGYFGEGRRRGIVSHFLLGVAVPKSDGDDPDTFYSFTKVGSGYSLQELYHLLNKMKDNWKVYDKKKSPSNIILASGHKEKPDLWIEPENSYIVQVKAAEIINSDRFKTNCTLRFPRVEKVRYDKPWNQCLTIKELEDLKKEADGKLASRHMGDDTGETSPRKRKIARRFDQEKTLAPHFRPTDVSNVEMVSETFGGKEFCVVNGSTTHSKADLEKMVTKLGGTFTQNPGDETFCIVSDSLNHRTKNLIKTGKYDILKCNWLLLCEKEKKIVPWNPFDFWYSKTETASKLSAIYDEYGDSYTEDIDEEQLALIFNNISKEKLDSVKINTEKINELEFKYFPNNSFFGLFRTLRVYVDNKMCISDVTTVIKNHCTSHSELQLRYFGAKLEDSLHSNVTHVLVHSKDLSRIPTLKDTNKSRKKMFHLVTEDWVFDSINAKIIQTERAYYP